MSEHLDETLLILYADDPATTPSRLAVENHLNSCEQCRATVDNFRMLTAAQESEETWWLLDELVDGNGRRAVREFAERCAREDAAAERLLRRALESPFQFAYADVARRMRFRTGGVVRLLCKRANVECDREPLFAIELADAAATIAESLPDDYYPANAIGQLRGNAWKEYATACVYLGRFQLGLDALDRAENAYRRSISSDIAIASVNLARGILLWKRNVTTMLSRTSGQLRPHSPRALTTNGISRQSKSRRSFCTERVTSRRPRRPLKQCTAQPGF